MISRKKLYVIGIMVLFVNVLVIVGILHFTSTKMEKKYSQPITSEAVDEIVETVEYSDEAIEEEDSSRIDGLRNADPAVSYTNVYNSLLIGEYMAEDGTVFRFADDASFSGFFNDDVPDVEHYTYEIKNENETENSLVIYSPDKRSEIIYSLDLDMEGNVILTIPDTETRFVLCYDGMLYKDSKPERTDETEDSEEISEEETETSEKTDEENSEESAEESDEDAEE